MKKIAVPTVAGMVLVLAAIQALAAIHYFQGFETDIDDWSGVTRVASGTNGVPSAAGDFHAEAADGAFTRFGGHESTFPAGGYTTSVDVYLDVEAGARTTRASIGHPRSTTRPGATAATSCSTPGSTTTLTPPGPVLAS
jgi:hypothetical protein